VDFIGEVDDGAKQSLLANALGVVFPIDWPEPFGLVMIEALACGTPVIAFDRGSVREVIDHGLTGFVVSSIDEAVDAVPRLRELDRRRCRSEFDRRFSARCMAENYVQLYLQVAQRRAQAEVEAAGDQVTADAHPSWDNVPSEAPWNPSQRAQPSSTLSQTSG
jgi:glycosyltransferase involved in cell wall biosynthesis